MHIPDGFVDAPVVVVSYVVAGLALAYAVRRTDRDLQEKQVPLMGVMAAFIFAAQMMNFPVAGGTSGHALGAALAAILLGPWAAMIVMVCVVGVQALIFQDGSLAALGSNALNMAILGYSRIHCLALRLRRQRTVVSRPVAIYSGGCQFRSHRLSSLGWRSRHFALRRVAPWWGYALIGIGEGLITVAAIGFIAATRRDLLPPSERAAR
jgi:cobalt/nickel transport system permease protein